MSKVVRDWHFNRPQPLTHKLKRWSSNPIGAIIRAIEFGYFKVPLVSLLKNVEHWHEVSHLNQDIFVNDNDIYIQNSVVHLENNLLRLNSGHILFVKMSYQSFMSGLHANEIKQLQRCKNVQIHSRTIPISKQDYYFHFVAEILPQILRIYSANKNLYVLSPANQPKYVVDFLALLEIPVVYSSETVVRLRDSIMARNATVDDHDILLAHLGSSAKATNDSWPDNIIILRRGLARDDQVLNVELISNLSEYGFHEVFMDDYSIESQIELFRRAKRVISLHGGALTNLIFCKPGTDVLEIFNGIYRNFDYEKIAQMRGLNYQSAESSEMIRIKEWACRKS